MITRLGIAAFAMMLAVPGAAKEAAPQVRDAAVTLAQQLFDGLTTGDTALWARTMADDGVAEVIERRKFNDLHMTRERQ